MHMARTSEGVNFEIAEIATPLGMMLALADHQGLRVLDFADRRGLPRQLERVKAALGSSAGTQFELIHLDSTPAAIGAKEHLARAAQLVDAYFAGRWDELDVRPDNSGIGWRAGGRDEPDSARDSSGGVRLVPIGTGGRPGGGVFQQLAWNALLNIPRGETRSYAQQASTLGRPAAVRAVARANGENFISILIPCHRVIGADGAMTGYGGGVGRKRWLLDHEGAGLQRLW